MTQYDGTKIKLTSFKLPQIPCKSSYN